jgi:hypothetical protein
MVVIALSHYTAETIHDNLCSCNLEPLRTTGSKNGERKKPSCKITDKCTDRTLGRDIHANPAICVSYRFFFKL